MLEGKRFLPETGMPILKIALRMVLLAVELPEPFLVPTVIEKSFTILFIMLLKFMESQILLCEIAPNLRSVIQKVGMSDQRLISSLIVTITNRFDHHLMIVPDFL